MTVFYAADMLQTIMQAVRSIQVAICIAVIIRRERGGAFCAPVRDSKRSAVDSDVQNRV